jgi:4-amino-4-deoxy-L-arabinose transferase-like glycosyltransferase
MSGPVAPVRRPGLLPLAVLLGLSLLIAAQALRTYDEPLEFDACLYATLSHELLAGRALYSDLWDIKPPAVHVTYAAAELLAGYGPRQIYFLSVAAAIATLLGVYAAGAALSGARAAGLWAALFWTLIWAEPGLEANQPNTEVFVNACIIWAFALMVRAGNGGFQVRRWLLLGSLFGLSLLYKPVVIAIPFILGGVHLAWAPERRRALGQIGVMTVTAVAMGLAVCGYFLAVGRFTDFYDVMIIHNRYYSGSITANLLQGLKPDYLWPSYLNPLAPLALLGTFGLVLGLLKPGRRPWVLLAALVIGIEVAICLPGKFFRHYYQFWLPPLAVAAGWALQELGQLAKKDQDSLAYPWLPRIVGVAALLVLLAHDLPLYRLSADQWSQRKYGDYYLVIKRMGQELGRLLQPDETLYNWGNESGLYFYSRRRPASGIIFYWPSLQGPLAPALEARLLADLKRSPPEVIITRRDHTSEDYQKHHPVMVWFKKDYRFWFQRGPFMLYFNPEGKLAARLGLRPPRSAP